MGSRDNMSPPAGQDEDDGGFLNTSNRSKGSGPNSQLIEDVRAPSLPQGHTELQAPPVVSTASTGISVQDPPTSNSRSMTGTTASQGTPANFTEYQGAYNRSPHQGGQGDKSLHSLSYTEFTRGLLSVTKNPPLPVTAGEDMNLRLSESGFIPSSFYLDRHNVKDQQKQPKVGRSRGYESDTGYKSDTQVYQRKKHHYNLDGYASDWEAVQRHHMPQRYLQRDGYCSDYDGCNRRGRGNYNVVQHQPCRPHSSYHPASQHSMSHLNSASQRSITSQHSASHHSIASQNRRSQLVPQQDQWRPSHNHGIPEVNAYPTTGGVARQQPVGYTNVPSTKRTMLRNDELYETYPGARGDPSKQNVTGQQQSQSRHSNSGSTKQPTTDPRQSNLVSVQHTPPPTRHSPSQQNTPNHDCNTKTPVDQSQAWVTPGSKQKTNLAKEKHSDGSSTEDEIWRAQLYQASVKLQKTPSEKRKQLQVNISVLYCVKLQFFY